MYFLHKKESSNYKLEKKNEKKGYAKYFICNALNFFLLNFYF